METAAQQVEFVLIAENGLLEQQAHLLCESIRRFAGALSSAQITVVSPRRSRRPSPATLRKLDRLQVEYLALEIDSNCPDYGSSFRVHGVAHVARRSGPPIVVQVDSDTLFVAEPTLLLQQESVAARPVDVKGMCTTGTGDEFDDYWRTLCVVIGIPYDRLPIIETTVDRIGVRASFNGGLLATRRDSGIFERTEEFFQRLVAAGLRPWADKGNIVQSSIGLVSEAGAAYWGTSQAAFSLATLACGRNVALLPDGYNFPLHYIDLVTPVPAPMVHIHYHWLASEGGGDKSPLLDARLGLPADTREWLRARLPLGAGERQAPTDFRGGFHSSDLIQCPNIKLGQAKSVNLMEHPASEPPSMPRRCVIVAGMHRCGTSAATRIVNLLGADVASALLPLTPGDNDRGYWESAAVVEIHDQLLRALGSAFDDPFPLPEGWLASGFARDAQHRLAEEIRRDFDGSRVFVVKDPRIARLLPLWLDLLDKLAIEPVVVIPVRNPLEVAASLGRREAYSVPPAQSLMLYIRSYLDAELASRGRRRLFVRYERLLTDWRHFATALGRILGTPFQSPAVDSAAAIDEFLTGDLYHNRVTREQLAQTPGIAATVVEMFDLMVETAETGDEKSLRRSFDRLRETTSEATKLFQGIVLSEREKAQLQLTRLRHDHRASEARVAELDSALAAEVAKSAALCGELAAIRVGLLESQAALAARSAELSTLQDRLTESEVALAGRSAELLVASRDAAALRTESEARSAEAASLSSKLAVMQNRARRSEEALRTLSKEHETVTQSMAWRMTGPLRSAGVRFPRLARRSRQCLEMAWRAASLLRGALRGDRDLAAASGEPDAEWAAFNARQDKAIIALSGLFDEEWYKESYPDVAAAGIDPIEHYLSCGALEGRDPSPLFDTLGYLSSDPDAFAEGENPLLHYIRARTRTGAIDPAGAPDKGYVLTSAHSTVGRLVSSFSKHSSEEEVAVIGVAVSKWRRNFPRI